MQLNKPKDRIHTHEGATAKHINQELQLRRSVMACLLWESQFYESGIEIATRIRSTIPNVDPNKVFDIAVEAREEMKLRHVPLLIARECARGPEKHRHIVADLLERVIQRSDELTEFLSIYWADKRQPLSNQVKRGLAAAIKKFDRYQLSKYDRKKAIKLEDVLFLTHPKPNNEEQAATWKALVEGTLTPPDTWEVALSSGADKKETFTRLIQDGKLGALALLRNLRNMEQAGVDAAVIRVGLQAVNVDRVLPFRFITAARHAVGWEPELEEALFRCLQGKDKLGGDTAIVVDVSGSMSAPLSNRSQVNRMEAACGVAMIARELCEQGAIFSFSGKTVKVPPRRGFALKDAIINSQPRGWTDLGGAVRYVDSTDLHRIIVITDEQSHTSVSDPKAKYAYMINVASYRNGVGYGKWTHIDGFSEAVLDYIRSYEENFAV